MTLAIFDLDNTLLSGDSDYLWGQFLIKKGLVDKTFYTNENQRFYQQYQQGSLDIDEFLKFSLKPLTTTNFEQLLQLRSKFIQDIIKPIIPNASHQLLNHHRQQGHFILIITATNRFITEPIAAELNADDLIATNPEFKNGRFTGQIDDIPCFQQGKVKRLKKWLLNKQFTLDDSWFYTDSHNDLPLLEQVTHPTVVNPDPTLAEIARSNHWPVISLL